MRNPRPVFQYSCTRNGCVPTSLINALVCCYRPPQLPGSVVRAIYRHSLDGRNGAGTSHLATIRIVEELNRLEDHGRSRTGWRCHARILVGEQVNVAPNGLLARTIRSGGAAVVDVCCGEWNHALTLLEIESEYWTFFDPYLWDRHPVVHPAIQFLGYPGYVHGPNLRITRRYLQSRHDRFYSLGSDRSAVILMPR